MEDLPKKPRFGALRATALTDKLRPAPPAARELGPLEELVLFSVRLTRADVLRLKEAHHWVPGFREQDFVQQAIREKLASLGEQVKPLPPDTLRELVRRNKKLQKG